MLNYGEILFDATEYVKSSYEVAFRIRSVERNVWKKNVLYFFPLAIKFKLPDRNLYTHTYSAGPILVVIAFLFGFVAFLYLPGVETVINLFCCVEANDISPS